ncbi:MAG: hypothetical protein ACFFDS_08075, partial [Candidatus Thorarchaeota archaeon]
MDEVKRLQKNKALALLLITTFLFSIVLNQTLHTTAYIVSSEPKLVNITVEGAQSEEQINYPNGTLITVEYSISRLYSSDLRGIVLVGNGSKLELDPIDGLALNFSESIKERSYYTGTFNLTQNTYFKAYGWIGDITNGTYEQVENFNHLGPWHYFYVNEEGTPPEFHSIINATSTGVPYVYYSPANQVNHSIVISYRVYGASVNDSVTLALSVYRDKITNASLDIFDSEVVFISMVWANISTSTYEVFNTTITLTERTIYFCANNSYGWDSWGDTGLLEDTMIIYKINNGFHFESKTYLSEPHTEVDQVNFTITSYNATDSETFGIGYYVVESSTNDTEIVPWTMEEAILETEYNVTKVNGYNDTIREYSLLLGPYDVGNILYYQAYNIYYGEIYNETAGTLYSLTIYDSRPQLTLRPLNETYFNDEKVTFSYEIELVRGNISGVLFDYGDGSPLDVLPLDETHTFNYTYAIVTSRYTTTLYVNNSLGTSNNISTHIILDFDGPIAHILSHTDNSVNITDGYVELYFNYSDDYSGVWYVYIDWDDGTVSNATGENFAFHIYVLSGEYSVTLMAVDRAGNQYNTSIVFTIKLPIQTTPQLS